MEQECENKLTNQEQSVVHNSGFLTCVRWMVDVVLRRPEVVEICSNGGFSMRELETIFRVKATLVSYGGNEDLNTHEVTLWCNTLRKIVEQCTVEFERGGDHAYQRVKSSGGGGGPTPVLNHDQMYKVFQEILKIRSIEHQVLYKECQVGVAWVEPCWGCVAWWSPVWGRSMGEVLWGGVAEKVCVAWAEIADLAKS